MDGELMFFDLDVEGVDGKLKKKKVMIEEEIRKIE